MHPTVPTVTPFTEEKYSQPVKRMFPQTDRDNPVSDPESSQCFADSETIGLVEVNDPRKSITRETIDISLSKMLMLVLV